MPLRVILVAKSKKTEDLKEQVKGFPKEPGVYLMKSESSKIIYVGKAKNIRSRVRSYFSESKDLPVKTQHLVNRIDHIEYILTKTEVEAFLLEASLIKKHKPRYNIRLKDDKAYPYIKCFIKHKYPRFDLARKVINDGALYFGPYTSGLAVRETIQFINRSFKIRDCSDSEFKNRKTPCMQYQIGRCSAPCVDYVTTSQYDEDVQTALDFLRGKDEKILKNLELKMKIAAQEERFEFAAKLRDSIQAIQRIWQKQTVVKEGDQVDKDFIAVAGDHRGTLVETLHIRSGRVVGSRPHFVAKLDISNTEENPKEWLTSFLTQYYLDNFIPDQVFLPYDLGHDIKKLLVAVLEDRSGKSPEIKEISNGHRNELMLMTQKNADNHFTTMMQKVDSRFTGLQEIKQKLGLPGLPLRIECYDISNFQGEESVASQVVFEEGSAKTDDYRRYKIKTVEGPNDFASMQEVLTRRFSHTEYDDPQLIVIDGGKGQLNMAFQVLEQVGRSDIPVVGLAKARTMRNFKGKAVEKTEERFFLPGRSNPVVFREASEAFQILVGIRDEAHRFALSYHRKLRKKRNFASVIDDIPGIGKKRKTILLKSFRSVEDIKKATIVEIAALDSFNDKLAQQILLFFEEQEDANSSSG